MRHNAPWIVVALGAAFLLGACGYSLAGRGSFLPSYIRSIGIPVFTNSTQSFDIEQILTQRIRAEFLGRGRYSVLPQETGVDAALTGDVIGLMLAPSAFDSEQRATRYAATLTVKIEFRDLRSGTVLWTNPALVFREEYEVSTVTSGSTDAALFFGQNTNALERLATEFARTVVTAILEAF